MEQTEINHEVEQKIQQLKTKLQSASYAYYVFSYICELKIDISAIAF